MDFLNGVGIVGGAVILIVLILVVFSSYFKTAKPDEALIISGSFLGSKNVHKDINGNKVKIIRHGGALVIPVFQQLNRLNLMSIKLDVSTPEVYTEQGVPIMADGTAIIKIGSTVENIATASEQFLRKDKEELENEAREVLEGHLRSILGSMTVEEIYQNRDKFSQSVQEVASVDLAKMGLVIVSFTIKDVKDKNGYLESLGRPQIAEVKKNAEVAEAVASKETRIRKALAEKESTKAELERQTEIAEATKEKELKLSIFKQEQDMAKARADQAYALENAKLEQEITTQKMQVQIIERERLIELEEKEIARRERQYDAEVRKKADAERYAIEQEAFAKKSQEIALAEAEASRVKALAKAEAEKISSLGKAQAESILDIGRSEAESRELLAKALNTYGEPAIIEMIVKTLPQMAEQIAKPMSNIGKVTVLDGGDGGSLNGFANTTGRLMTSTQEVFSETLGLDFKDLINSYVGNKNIGANLKEINGSLNKKNEDKELDNEIKE